MMGTREEQGCGMTTLIPGTGIKSVVLLDLDQSEQQTQGLAGAWRVGRTRGVGKGTSDQHSPQRRCTEKERAVHRRSRRQQSNEKDPLTGNIPVLSNVSGDPVPTLNYHLFLRFRAQSRQLSKKVSRQASPCWQLALHFLYRTPLWGGWVLSWCRP